MRTGNQKASALFFLVMLSFVVVQSCSNTQVSGAGNSTSVYANPDSVHFTPENLVFMLRQTYYNFDLSPPQDDIDSITHATSDDDAMKAYDLAIDNFVDGGQMRDRFREIGRQMFGMVSDDRKPGTRYPENLLAYVFTNDLPVSELLTATYAISDSGSKVTSDYTDNVGNVISPPVDKRAGYATYEEYMTTYLNTAGFKMDRELIGINLCDVAPYSKFDSFSWTIDQVNSKYRIAEDGTSCFNCHAKKEPLRGAWHYFNPNNRTWIPSNVQSTNQYDQELIDAGGATLEPRNPNDTAMSAATAEATMYKFSASGPVVLDPASLAKEIIKQPRYPRCWTERMLAIFLNLDPGHPGQGFVPPNNFAASAAQIAFLDKWTDTFNQQRQIPQEWFRTFLKDPDYLILSYSPDSTNN